MCIVCGINDNKKYCSKKCYDLEYRKKNKARKAEADRAWREKNKDHVTKTQKKYVEKNRDKVLAYRKEWRARHIEEKKAKDKKRYLEKKGEFILREKQYKENNPVLYKINQCAYSQLGTIKGVGIVEKKSIYISLQFKKTKSFNLENVRKALNYE